MIAGRTWWVITSPKWEEIQGVARRLIREGLDNEQIREVLDSLFPGEVRCVDFDYVRRVILRG